MTEKEIVRQSDCSYSYRPYRIEREWIHAGLPCVVVQTREGFHRCGYVFVPAGHPADGKDYGDVDVDVHGGLTFGEPGKDGRGTWFGFDCAHFGDALVNPDPTGIVSEEYKNVRRIHLEVAARFEQSLEDEHYWTQEEVEQETERLADQLAAMMGECVDLVGRRKGMLEFRNIFKWERWCVYLLVAFLATVWASVYAYGLMNKPSTWQWLAGALTVLVLAASWCTFVLWSLVFWVKKNAESKEKKDGTKSGSDSGSSGVADGGGVRDVRMQ